MKLSLSFGSSSLSPVLAKQQQNKTDVGIPLVADLLSFERALSDHWSEALWPTAVRFSYQKIREILMLLPFHSTSYPVISGEVVENKH